MMVIRKVHNLLYVYIQHIQRQGYSLKVCWGIVQPYIYLFIFLCIPLHLSSHTFIFICLFIFCWHGNIVDTKYFWATDNQIMSISICSIKNTKTKFKRFFIWETLFAKLTAYFLKKYLLFTTYWIKKRWLKKCHLIYEFSEF